MPFGFLLIDHEQSFFGLVSRAYNKTIVSERIMAMQNLDEKEERDTVKAKVFDISLINEFVGVKCQLIKHHRSDFNKFGIPLTDTAIQKKKCIQNFHCEMAVIHCE